MSKRRVDHEPGYVLHTYPYKETSLIVEAFTHRFGRVALLARGARRPRSAMRGVLLSFHPLRLSWSGSADLANLMNAEWAGGIPLLGGRGLQFRVGAVLTVFAAVLFILSIVFTDKARETPSTGDAGLALALHTAAHPATEPISGWDACLLINTPISGGDEDAPHARPHRTA